MASGTFGRTNRVFPPIWLRLGLPRTSEELEPLLEAAGEASLPIDITSQPGLWGGRLRGPDRFFTYVGSSHFEHSTDQTHAANLVQADLIQTLSAIGNETIDIYFLRVRRAIEEFQINGVLEALESAKQEGHIRFLGLCCDGNPFASLSLWQFHDAFDVLQVPSNPVDQDAYETLTPLAKERRVGILGSKTLDWLGDQPFQASSAEDSGEEIAKAYLRRATLEHPALVNVRSATDIQAVLESSTEDSSPEVESRLDQVISLAVQVAQLSESGLSSSAGSRGSNE